jgi:DegV family protein with EDD domain
MFKIVTDSTANMPREIMDEFGITMIPTYVHFGNEMFLDVVQLPTDEFYKRMVSSKELPTTTQVTVSDFARLYKQIAADQPGVTIVSIHISAALSGIIESARQAAASVPDTKIVIFDSRSAAQGHGLMVRQAAALAKSGASLEQIIQKLTDMRSRTRLYFMVDTLEYLARGGRIGRAARFLGTILDTKPILTIKDGTLEPYERQRTRVHAVRALRETVIKEARGKPGLQLGVMHAACEEDARVLADDLRRELSPEVLVVGQIGPSIGTHTGPGALGVSWYALEQPAAQPGGGKPS